MSEETPRQAANKPEMRLAYFAFYPADFVADTQHLTAEQVGAYIRILCFLWQKGRAKESYLKAVGFGSVSVSLSEWEDIALLLETDGFVFWSRRLEKERENSERKHKIKSENGKKGGRPKKPKLNESYEKPIAFDSLKLNESNHNHNHNHNTEDSLRSSSVSETQAREATPTPPQNFGQTPEQLADRNGPPSKERFLAYAKGNAGWTALGLTEAEWESIWLYGVGIEWRMPTGQPISDWKHWGLAQARKQKNNPQPAYRPATKSGFDRQGRPIAHSVTIEQAQDEIQRQMNEYLLRKGVEIGTAI